MDQTLNFLLVIIKKTHSYGLRDCTLEYFFVDNVTERESNSG